MYDFYPLFLLFIVAPMSQTGSLNFLPTLDWSGCKQAAWSVVYETDFGPYEIVYEMDSIPNETDYEMDSGPKEIVYEKNSGPNEIVYKTDSGLPTNDN